MNIGNLWVQPKLVIIENPSCGSPPLSRREKIGTLLYGGGEE